MRNFQNLEILVFLGLRKWTGFNAVGLRIMVGNRFLNYATINLELIFEVFGEDGRR
jgi:hypothetical protein